VRLLAAAERSSAQAIDMAVLADHRSLAGVCSSAVAAIDRSKPDDCIAAVAVICSCLLNGSSKLYRRHQVAGRASGAEMKRVELTRFRGHLIF
jgi:hypothetical protein